MSDRKMNLKLTNEVRSSVSLLHNVPVSSIKEERRRTGRYIAILVGILLLLLAVYHAWVRRIPVVASLVVPALIMFVYVGWVLYTASRDKLKLMDAEAAMAAAAAEANDNEINGRTSELSHNNIEISVISSKESSRLNSPSDSTRRRSVSLSGIPSALRKEEKAARQKPVVFVKPIILVNDKLPEDLDQKWSHIVDNITNNEKFKGLPTRRRYRRRFVRRRHTVFKRSYSIA